MELINKKENIFGDDIGFVEHYDFSQANMSEKHRIHAISAVASICYQNPKAVGSESLYNRLLAESKGLPSSSFEFVPVLIPMDGGTHIKFLGEDKDIGNVIKYSEVITHKGIDYLLTNYRAIVYDVENKLLEESALDFFNTRKECEIIKKHFKVFLYKVDLPTRSQMVRHRISWQELSRRYVSAKRVPFEINISEKMKGLESEHEDYYMDGMSDFETDFINTHSTEKLIEMCIEHYYQALENGVKPQEARRIIPQAAYTQIWGAFQPKQLENYLNLRLDESAQWEIRMVSKAMQELINGRK